MEKPHIHINDVILSGKLSSDVCALSYTYATRYSC